jgi:Kef-type K+ transport system membrane component KefB
VRHDDDGPLTDVFSEFAILLLISAAAGAMALRLRQPVLIAYIAVGIVAGPGVLGLVRRTARVDLLAQVGVAVLLFVVGLKLDVQHIRHLGPVAARHRARPAGFTIVFGFLLTRLLGRPPLEALYIAVALTFSSTIIIVKLLSDKREIDSLHGRIAVGFLIVQDLAVVLAMMVMSAMRGECRRRLMLEVLLSLGWRIAAAAAALFVLMRWVLPPVGGRHGAVAGTAAGLRRGVGHRDSRHWENGRASLARPGPSSPASRSRPPRIAMPSTRASRGCATSCCSSSSSTSAPSSTSPRSAASVPAAVLRRSC